MSRVGKQFDKVRDDLKKKEDEQSCSNFIR